MRRAPLGACKVDSTASPQFSILVEHWQARGYPSAKADLESAFQKICKDVKACDRREPPRFSAVLGNYKLFKYRYKNTAAREGASGGWRFYALYDSSTNTLYPILPYPHKEWVDAPDSKIIEGVKEIVQVIKRGHMLPVEYPVADMVAVAQTDIAVPCDRCNHGVMDSGQSCLKCGGTGFI